MPRVSLPLLNLQCPHRHFRAPASPCPRLPRALTVCCTWNPPHVPSLPCPWPCPRVVPLAPHGSPRARAAAAATLLWAGSGRRRASACLPSSMLAPEVVEEDEARWRSRPTLRLPVPLEEGGEACRREIWRCRDPRGRGGAGPRREIWGSEEVGSGGTRWRQAGGGGGGAARQSPHLFPPFNRARAPHGRRRSSMPEVEAAAAGVHGRARWGRGGLACTGAPSALSAAASLLYPARARRSYSWSPPRHDRLTIARSRRERRCCRPRKGRPGRAAAGGRHGVEGLAR
ncbi:unnamed protein product [Urochloa humidicola]